jgi:hypothetical protein
MTPRKGNTFAITLYGRAHEVVGKEATRLRGLHLARHGQRMAQVRLAALIAPLRDQTAGMSSHTDARA